MDVEAQSGSGDVEDPFLLQVIAPLEAIASGSSNTLGLLRFILDLSVGRLIAEKVPILWIWIRINVDKLREHLSHSLSFTKGHRRPHGRVDTVA